LVDKKGEILPFRNDVVQGCSLVVSFLLAWMGLGQVEPESPFSPFLPFIAESFFSQALMLLLTVMDVISCQVPEAEVFFTEPAFFEKWTLHSRSKRQRGGKSS
jgi:hypothetical protein